MLAGCLLAQLLRVLLSCWRDLLKGALQLHLPPYINLCLEEEHPTVEHLPFMISSQATTWHPIRASSRQKKTPSDTFRVLATLDEGTQARLCTASYTLANIPT